MIDVHAHVIPPALVEAMREGLAPDGIVLEQQGDQTWVVHRQGYRYPLLDAFHDVTSRLATMDPAGHRHRGPVHRPAPVPLLDRCAEGRRRGKLINDAMGSMVEQAPDRFAGLATLPMQDPAAAVAELRRCVDTLGFRGAQIGPHIEGVPLDDASLRPVLEAAAELGVPLVIHPYYVGSTPGRSTTSI